MPVKDALEMAKKNKAEIVDFKFIDLPGLLMSGVLVVLSVLFFDKIKIDDPVGATSVHLVCGIFGTICVGLIAQAEFTPNTTGMVCFLAVVPGS